jgi:ATP phosphoribosyltransferase regulatory subunit
MMLVTPIRDAETVLSAFERAGYARIEPPILQPADIFLDLSGEEIRHRLFVTSDTEGREWALRPEFTIPVALAYLTSGESGAAKAYSYSGRVFRVRQNEPNEFIQAGIESFGRTDTEATDAEILFRAQEALHEAGETDIETRLGDMGLFNALLSALGLQPVWQRRLKRAFAKGLLDAPTLASMADHAPDRMNHAGLLNAMQGQDPKAARAFVEDLLQIAGISTVGGRSAGEIAERFLAQASHVTEGQLPDEARDILLHYSSIEGDPDTASNRLRTLVENAGLDGDEGLASALDAFDTRSGFLAARGVALDAIAFSAKFGRNLDYYTGAVFEVRRAGEASSRPLVGGGRYDRLLQALGAEAPIPAVGCAIFMDRLQGGAA